MSKYSDMMLFADVFTTPEAEESVALLPDRIHQARPCPTPWRSILGGGLGMLFLASGITLKVYNLADPNFCKSVSDQMCYKYDTIANLMNGIATTMLADALLPDAIRTAVFNKLKQYCVPLFEIATQVEINVAYAQGVYGNPAATQAVQQLLITPVTMAASGLVLDDILTIRNLTPQSAPDERIRKKPIPLLIEGDAKSRKRMVAQQGAILAMGIALTVLGLTLNISEQSKVLIRDAGIITSTYALGSVLAKEAHTLLEKLKSGQGKGPPPRVLTALNTLIKTFQLTWPIGVGISVVPDNPVSYGITGLLYGAGHRLSQLFFQYRQAESDTHAPQRGLLDRIKGIWNTRKVDIGLNATFFAIMTGWMIWGEAAGDTARIRGAVGALFGSTVASTIGTAMADLAWNPGDSGLLNSLFYNLVALPPWAIVYLLGQTKVVANDIYLDEASPFGYMCGLAALSALGLSVGSDRWTQMREGRPEPALTSFLGRSLLWWTVMKAFTGQIERPA